MTKHSLKIVYTLAAVISACFYAGGAARAADSEYYSVVAEVLPIMSVPGAEYEISDGVVEWNERVEGVVVYGNRLKLRPSGKKGWSELISPEDGASLGCVETSGVEKFPEYEKTDTKYYMAAKDAPELLLLPGKSGKKYNLSSFGYSLLKGETVPSRGRLGKMILLEFGTLLDGGSAGVGERCAWGREEDFIALDSHKPDNGRIDARSIPSKIRAGDDVSKIPDALFKRISKHGFAIDTTPVIRDYLIVDDMADSYNETGDYEVDFITTDIFLHSFHLLFDHSLQKLERVHLAPALAAGLRDAASELERIKGRIPGGALSSYETARDMFSVPRALLAQNPDEAGLSPAAREEAASVAAASGIKKSLLTGQNIDYTTFAPRGHYTLTPEFKRYFRAMSYLGSAELPLFDEGTRRPIVKNVRTAALISLVIDALGERWEAFETPIGFLVGVPNSGDPKVFRALVRKHIGPSGEALSYKNLSEAAKINSLAGDIASMTKGPAIQSVIDIDREGDDFDNRAPVFRISGKRFTWDAYVMNMLTSPRAGTDDLPRNIPEGTDVMAALGSDAADKYARKDDNVKNYRLNLNALKAATPGYLSKDNTLYSKWLSALLAGFEHSGSDQFFYNDPSWRRKKLLTGLASWAEMKHDTILYAEQSGSEMGGAEDLYAGQFAPPNPRGYVEPDPQTFGALLGAVNELSRFIERYAMEPEAPEDDFYARADNYGEKLNAFAKLLSDARVIAEKEARGEPMGSEDYERIKAIARGFKGDILLPGLGGVAGEDADEQLKMALIADAATNGFDKTVLEAATGTPRKIYVFLNDRSGGARLARGYVYSYYEFARPLSLGRMTDEEWKEIVYDGSRAEELEKFRPDWYGELEK
jgi:hypothetical protein